MTILDTNDFDSDQTEAIQRRLEQYDFDIARAQAEVDDVNERFDKIVAFDGANQLVQQSAMEDIITILYAVITQRDLDEPGEAPHFIKFQDPGDVSAGQPSFPFALPDLYASDDILVYLAGLPDYDTPVASYSVENGDLSTPTGGWELWHTIAGPTEERDPVQPSTGELTGDYDVAVEEFNDRNEERLDSDIGSFILKSVVLSQVAVNTNLITILNRRKIFWESVGFSGG